MNALREAFEKWLENNGYEGVVQDAFEAGWQAAIAAVKGGGFVASVNRGWLTGHVHTEDAFCESQIDGWIPLYRLPEDV